MFSRPNKGRPRSCEVEVMLPPCILEGELTFLYLAEVYISLSSTEPCSAMSMMK